MDTIKSFLCDDQKIIYLQTDFLPVHGEVYSI